jgi:uncharacterized protein YkwD
MYTFYVPMISDMSFSGDFATKVTAKTNELRVPAKVSALKMSSEMNDACWNAIKDWDKSKSDD